MVHRPLLEKLKQLNLNPILVRWICSYLMGRSQKVVVDGETSETMHVDSGVPQGSVLGPLLFIIYIDGITSTDLSTGSKISLYADDMLLFKTIKSNTDYNDLQQDIDSLNRWVTIPTTLLKMQIHAAIQKEESNPSSCTKIKFLSPRKSLLLQIPWYMLDINPLLVRPHRRHLFKSQEDGWSTIQTFLQKYRLS